MQSKNKTYTLFFAIAVFTVIALAVPVSAILVDPPELTVHNLDTNEHFGTIQGAIDDAQTLAGHIILVDSKTYNEDVDVTKAVTLRGNDTDTGFPVINGTGASSGKSVTLNANGVTMEGFTVWRSGRYGIFLLSDNNVLTDITVGGEDPVNQDTGIYFSQTPGSDGNTLTNCAVSGAERGMEIGRSSNNVFTGCTATGNSWKGIYLISNSNNNVFTGCTATGNDGNGFEVSYSSNNNSFTDCTATGNSRGFYLSGDAQVSLTDNVITGCTASNNEAHGIALYASDNTTLQGCTTNDNEYNGIQIQSSDNCILTRCTVIGNCNSTEFMSIAGIHARDGSSDLTLTDCTVSENNADGVYLMGNSNNATITGCTFSDNDEYGIYLSSCSGAVFTDCTAMGNTVDGIYLIQSGNAQLTGCVASENLQSGLYAVLSGATDFTGCSAGNNAQDGLYCSMSDDCTFSDCTATGNDGSGIRLDSSTGTTVTGCTIRGNGYGVRLLGATGTTLFNNFFYNSQNTYFPGTSDNCAWNTVKTAGQNIVNGPYLGGNYWGTPEGTGFSQTHADADGDGICDEPYIITTGHTDELPLAYIMTADFTASPTSGTTPLSVAFTGTATGSPTSWTWDFGDGSSGNVQNPSHTYTDPGTYGVSLTVSNDYGAVEKTRTAYITALTPSSPDGGGKSTTGVDAASNLNAGDPASFNFDGSPVYLVVVTPGDDIPDIMITVSGTGLPSSIPAPNGTVFEFIEVTLYKTTDDLIDQAEILFTVPLEWLEEEGFDPADIVLYRWHDGEWQELPTTFVKEEDGKAYFTATSPGFSLFAIAAVEEIAAGEGATTVPTGEPTVQVTEAEETTEPVSTATPTPEPTQSPLLWAPVLALCGVLLLLRRRG